MAKVTATSNGQSSSIRSETQMEEDQIEDKQLQ
jgi:hypothetical protein